MLTSYEISADGCLEPSGDILIGSDQMADNNYLFYGDNLDVLRKHVKDETVDLCYIDPPFNSQRNYNQIYDTVETRDKPEFKDSAQAEAFTDTWKWDDMARAGFNEILSNDLGRFTSQTVELTKGLRSVLGETNSGLLAYIISITLRVTEIHRILKPTGSFYLHCDPTASHYLKLMLDAIFGQLSYRNEIVWKRTTTVKGNFGQGSKLWGQATDSLLFYTKSNDYVFNQPFKPYTKDYIEAAYRHVEDGTNRRYRLVSMIGPGGAAKGNPQYEVLGVTRFWRYSKEKMQALIDSGLVIQSKPGTVPNRKYYLDEGKGVPVQSWWDDIANLQASDAERRGYPTQKPLALLERIIKASSNKGEVVLDAYCGCGTSIDAAQSLDRKWIGIDITFQSIAVILERLEKRYSKAFVESINLNGIPKDMKSAVALANKKDDRLRKEFEMWALLTYTNNRAVPNNKKGADGGIDGIAYFRIGKNDNAKIIFQVKSGGVKRNDIATLRGDMEKTKAAMAVLITLEEPTKSMLQDAKAAGEYKHEWSGKSYDRIEIVTVREIIEKRKRLDIPLGVDVLKGAQRAIKEEQLALLPIDMFD